MAHDTRLVGVLLLCTIIHKKKKTFQKNIYHLSFLFVKSHDFIVALFLKLPDRLELSGNLIPKYEHQYQIQVDTHSKTLVPIPPGDV